MGKIYLPEEEKMVKNYLFFGLLVVLTITSCISMAEIPPSPNSSQSVITVKRSSSNIEARRQMEILIDGRKEGKQVANGSQGQALIMNGLHNIQVKVGRYQSQMLTFDCRSEVVEFYANFEGARSLFGNTTQLNLIKTSGGSGGSASSGNNSDAQPTINITVDNSSSNSAASSGNSSTNTNTDMEGAVIDNGR
jgi:hypothetical protein